MLPCNLRDRTVALVKTRPANLQLKDIAYATGVPLGWVKVFAQGRIVDPGVCRVQAIYEYMTQEKLNLK